MTENINPDQASADIEEHQEMRICVHCGARHIPATRTWRFLHKPTPAQLCLAAKYAAEEDETSKDDKEGDTT